MARTHPFEDRPLQISRPLRAHPGKATRTRVLVPRNRQLFLFCMISAVRQPRGSPPLMNNDLAGISKFIASHSSPQRGFAPGAAHFRLTEVSPFPFGQLRLTLQRIYAPGPDLLHAGLHAWSGTPRCDVSAGSVRFFASAFSLAEPRADGSERGPSGPSAGAMA